MNDTTTEQIIPAVVTEAPAVPVIKSKIEEHFNSSFLELIKLSPNNPIVRAQMMRILLKEPPKELDGFDALKKWVEENFESKTGAATRKCNSDGRVLFDVEWNISDVEYGRCDYSVRRSGSYVSSTTMDDIQQWIDDEKSVQEITDMLYDEISDNYSTDHMQSYDGSEYDNEEPDRTDNFEAEPDGGYRTLRTRLLEAVRTNLGNDYATALENNTN
jgi:hypothetical protein